MEPLQQSLGLGWDLEMPGALLAARGISGHLYNRFSEGNSKECCLPSCGRGYHTERKHICYTLAIL